MVKNDGFNMTGLENVFFSIIRSAIGTGKTVESVQLNEKQWVDIFQMSKKQGLSAVVFEEIIAHGNNMPFNVKMEWAFHSDHIKERHERQLAVTQDIAGFLNKNGIKMMLLKGNGLALLYPRPELRECGDIDIYCFGDYEKVNQLIENEGIEIDEEDSKHSHFFYKGVAVENHRMFNYELNKANKIVSRELIAHFDKNPISDERIPNVFFADLNINALYVMMHTLNHLPWSGIPVRNLVDWTLFLKENHERLDWNYLGNIWKESGLFNAVVILSEICKTQLGCKWFDLDAENIIKTNDYHYVMHYVMNPWVESSATKNKFRKVQRKIDQYYRHKKMHFIVYQEPFPDSLPETLFRYAFKIKKKMDY